MSVFTLPLLAGAIDDGWDRSKPAFWFRRISIYGIPCAVIFVWLLLFCMVKLEDRLPDETIRVIRNGKVHHYRPD